jgi:hypothetical protein
VSRSKGIANNGKVLSLRIPDELAREIAAISRVEGVPVSETIRAALSTRRSEEDFRERLRRRIEEDREVLERFGG